MRNFYTLLFALFILNAQAQTDFFYDEWQPKSYTLPAATMDYTENPGGGSVYITVDIEDTVNLILPTVTGNNLPAWRGSLLGNTGIIDHIERMQPRTMRIPGGNWSNTWLWDGINHWDGSNGNGYSGTLKAFDNTTNYLDKIRSEPTISWTLTTDELLQICNDWGVEPQICVNYALARYIDAPDAVQQAAHYAAEWVRSVNKNGTKVKYWEIGNEHYGSWQAGYVVEGDTLTGHKYGTDACVFIDSMKAADPNIKIGIVLYPDADYRSMPNYTPEVLKAAGDKADFLIVHEYFTWAKEPNDIEYSEILGALPKISYDYDTIQSMVRRYTNKQYIPTAMTEYNYRGGKKETEAVASLFFAHALGEYMTSKYGLVNFWDIQNGAGEEDHGMFTLQETGVEDNIPHPSFFPYYFYNKMFGDALVSSQSSDEEVFVYASRFSNNYAAVAVINESGSDKDVSITFPHYRVSDTVYRYELSTDALSSRKIYINNITSPTGELYAPRDYDNIPPYMQKLSGKGIITGVKKYSVNYFVVKIKEYTSIFGHRAADFSLSVSPNPATDMVSIFYDLPRASDIRVEVYNTSGQLMDVLEEGMFPQGRHSNRYDVSKFTPGVYIINLKSRLGSETKKLIIR